MPSLLLYLLKLSISLSIAWIFYQVILRRLTFYKLNRWYLLGYSLLSFLIPLINIGPMFGENPSEEPLVIQYIPAIGNVGAAAILPTIKRSVINGWSVLILIIVLGAILLLVRSAARWLSLRRLRKHARLIVSEGMNMGLNKELQMGLKIYQVEERIIPFSFGGAIYINQHLHTEKEWSDIILHEYVHIRQRHTIDILLAELLCVLNWYNPFCWLIRHSIRQNLEFIADSQVLNCGVDRKGYQYHLLQVIGEPRYRLANNFNFSSLKKRIVMMNKIRSARLHLVKLLFLVPLVAVLLLAFRDRYSDLLHQSSGPIYVNAAGIVISLPGKAPLAGVVVLDKTAGMETTTDEKGYYKLKILVTGDSMRVHLDFIKKGYDNDFRERYWPVLKETEGMLDVGTMNQPEVSREGNFIIAPSLNGQRAPADPGYEDAEKELHRVLKENVELNNFLAMEKTHPEVGLFYVTEDHQTHIVIHKDGSIEKYMAAGHPSFDDMDKKYGALPEFMSGYNHQVNSGYLARWAGISAQAEKEFHATGKARAIIFPGDSRVIAVPMSGKPQIYDMDNSDPKERPAFEGLYGKLPDCVPGAGMKSHVMATVGGADSRPTVRVAGPAVDVEVAGPAVRAASHDTVPAGAKSNPDERPAGHVVISGTIPPHALYVIDGQEMSKDSIPMPQDQIYSIDVLKGEKAVHYFGERGESGVVVITTKVFHELHRHPIRSIYSDSVDLAEKNNQPLYIIDGKEVALDSASAWMKTLDPDRIESITVLKNKEALTKYGEKAKNGVLIITLKKNSSLALPPHSQVLATLNTKEGPVTLAADTILMVGDKISTRKTGN
jgi:beta-lactamase regulating signal transducer with metallopeptidase domain